MRAALIHNPHSRLNLKGAGQFLEAAQERLGGFCFSARDQKPLVARMRTLQEAGVNTVMIDGGDGTISGCLTAMAQVWPHDQLPAIAVLASGNTNLIAQDVGFGLRGVAALNRLLDGGPCPYRLRAPIRLTWPGAPERHAVLGMFGGCAGYARAIRIAHSPTMLRYAPHDLAVVLTVASSIGRLFFKRSRQEWLAGDSLRWTRPALQGGGVGAARERDIMRRGHSFLFLATGLEKLSYGIWPFWREGQDGRHGFHFLNVSAFPARMGAVLYNLLRGRAPAWLRTHADYVSGIEDQALEMHTNSDFVMDGEVFPTPPDQRVTLERGPVFRFLHA
ncbi:hypothetical protein E3E12_00135 [Formicincola oecophyllae]|uniref:DAGKc domain-containing protein n=1 Tax=Formicincola oecophyllae TaxID=2558361 RepID=A0A4Y6UCP4_9PROT|nr:hypothetical protein E3E12_00135 [Formicincola oecophyllae]